LEIEILSIKRVPRWKFWKLDQWEVKVRVDGKEKTVTIFDSPRSDVKVIEESDLLTQCFLEYVTTKVVYGTKWRSDIKKELRYKRMEERLQELVGKKVKVEETR